MDPATTNLDVLFDARWIGIGGPGRVTQHMLEGLSEIKPPGRWTIWGPAAVDRYLWSSAEWTPNKYHPHRLFGQREFRGPRSISCDVAFYPHQMRPLRKLCAIEITLIHDTIPFRYPPRKSLSPLMRAYLRRVAGLSDLVATVSDFSRVSIEEDLDVDPSRIRVLRSALDPETARRLRARRASTPSEMTALYLGADLPHKNLDRLLEAFTQTSFQQRGGKLIMVGMPETSCRRLSRRAELIGAQVVVLGYVSEQRLDDLMASARLLVQPSLEEGFGLPVAEAIAAGIACGSEHGRSTSGDNAWHS
jgi:glycosyltransferase involved in cell wall biosynthesis